MHLISWIIRLTADRCISSEFQRLINSRQSVSRQSLVILSSCTIWIPSLQASASIIKASQASLYRVACPAMKRPSWFHRITPVDPELHDVKNAPSTLHLCHPPGGAFHLCTCLVIWGFSGWSRCQRSTDVSCTHSSAWRTGSGASPCLRLFHIIHSDHMPHKIPDTFFRGQISGCRRSRAHVRSWSRGNLTPVIVLASSQNKRAIEQSMRACLIVSYRVPQTSQLASFSICRRWRAWRAGKKPCSTRHQNTLTLAGLLVSKASTSHDLKRNLKPRPPLLVFN
jgi:hypothetical protein